MQPDNTKYRICYCRSCGKSELVPIGADGKTQSRCNWPRLDQCYDCFVSGMYCTLETPEDSRNAEEDQDK